MKREKEEIQLNPNGHAIGIILKEIIRRAINVIRGERFNYESQKKIYYDGISEDLVTSADKKAQSIFIRSLVECFPKWGIIAEEESEYQEERKNLDKRFYFTVDPLDGTKAFDRKQSHGVGTMISLSFEDEVIAAYVGDVNTQEIYGFRPGSNHVWRVNEYDSFQELLIDENRPLCEQYIQLATEPTAYFKLSKFLIQHETRPFLSYEILGGSYGVNMARLWKSEIGGILLPPHHETPWDGNPVLGINKKLGFVHLSIGERSNALTVYNPAATKEKYYRDHDTLVIHKSRIDELRKKSFWVIES